MASHPPIPIMDLAEHLERLKANDNLKFSQEYEVLNQKLFSLTGYFIRAPLGFHSLAILLETPTL